jgi:tRNA G18 (ribose-2'-O)-methylase SpoU
MTAIAAHPRETFLLLRNDRKSNTLGTVLRCASAFGIRRVVAVGYAKCNVAGSHGAAKNVEVGRQVPV